ncbi:hypothetical protein pipiens_006526 [Culex pipiens pipiens]|uniref:LIM zinc-binding domain-containing protein n=1 Tax=Culex pipiens pipiens TaxID=38569 RepID=A0ABD1DP50_CULPP
MVGVNFNPGAGRVRPTRAGGRWRKTGLQDGEAVSAADLGESSWRMAQVLITVPSAVPRAGCNRRADRTRTRVARGRSNGGSASKTSASCAAPERVSVRTELESDGVSERELRRWNQEVFFPPPFRRGSTCRAEGTGRTTTCFAGDCSWSCASGKRSTKNLPPCNVPTPRPTGSKEAVRKIEEMSRQWCWSGLPEEKYAICGHLIMKMILQAKGKLEGKSYHSECFRCSMCNEIVYGYL